MTESKAKIQRSKRTDHIKAERKESMRQKISFAKTLQSIDETESSLIDLARGVDEPSNARIGAYRALLDSQWKKMDRLLPSLRAVEHTGDVDTNITISWGKPE